MSGPPSVRPQEDWLKTIEELGCLFVEASPEIEREKEIMAKSIPQFVGLVCEHYDYFMQMSEDGTYDNLSLLFHGIGEKVSNPDNKRAKLQILLDCLDEALEQSRGVHVTVSIGDKTDEEYTNSCREYSDPDDILSAEETHDMTGF